MEEKRKEETDILSLIQNSVNEGIKQAIKEYDREKEIRHKVKYDRRLRNTGLLLKNYRNFKEYCNNAIYEVAEAVEKNVEEESNYIEIFDEIYDMNDESTIVRSILKAKERTLLIMKHIETCIEFYEYKAFNSKNEEFKRRVEVIKRLYINDKVETFEEIAKDLFVSTKTVNRDRKKARDRLG